MVVNKKSQIGPAMASRTSSSQPILRKKVSVSPLATPPTPTPPTPPLLEPNSKSLSKKSKSKKQSVKAVKKSGSWFSDRVLLLFLGLFVVYALRVCPTDYGLHDPVCWGLAKYRAGVVDAYMVPPVRRVLGHPSVRPVVRMLEPAVEKGVKVLRPVARRAARGMEEAGAFVEPRYRAYVKPYVDPISKYASSMSAYTARVTPYIRKLYTTISPYVQKGYQLGRPRVVVAYRVCAQKLGELRRKFVDPHVGVLWIKVVELSRGEMSVPPSTSTEPASITEQSHSDPATEQISSAESTKDSASTTTLVPTSTAELTKEDPVSTTTEEYDEFLADLGIDFDVASESVSTTATSTSFIPPTESTRDAAAIASKRANITARHAAWASQLDALAAARAATVRANLSRIRSRAAAVLFGQAIEEQETDLVGGVHVSKLLDGFVDEAEKLVGGLEGWWKKEPKDEDRRERGEKVILRVEEKLETLVREMGERVEKWATRVREDEVRECVVASREVKTLAEKAQGDLGLDYAWLEDVTYEDWQRYHDLMRVYTEFDTQIRQLQNNTHVKPLGDTVLIALEAKQHDMQDAITGFVSRIARIREDMDNRMKPNLDSLLMGKSKEQVEQAFEQAEPKSSKRSVGGEKHGMPVAPQVPKVKEDVKILPVGEMTEEEVRRDPGEL
ncbi:hypothetical protein DFS33DRAFT_956980 [Desarmillaria ectypa]|nr:hypothetical protein DFS33DRAFT_956980 [Desarmillaria ectypa]